MTGMTPTLVTFPGGSLRERATVQSATRRSDPDAGDRLLVVTDRTPFHPVDPGWPDQGPDRGTLGHGDRRAEVLDCVIGATDGGTLSVGADVPGRRGEPGWSFVVVHVLAPDELDLAAGAEVTLVVDAGPRAALSAGHTGCHLAALALNAALAGRWRKAPRPDGLGRPDFDGAAIVTSRIEPFGSVDEYRLGRSLRRSGFDPAGLAGDLPAVVAAVNATLAGWVAAGAVRVEVAGPALADRREWVCELPDGTARIPCGGTHVGGLAELGAVRVTLELSADGQQLTMRTAVGG